MTKLFGYLVLILGVLSPFLAQWLYSLTYATLTRASTDREQDWLFRLAMSALAMTAPFFATLFLAWMGWRRQRTQDATSRSEKRRQQRATAAAPNRASWVVRIGLIAAALSLLLLWKPISDGTSRWKQQRNMAMSGVPAPAFDTLDIDGNPQRLADHKGQVVVVNIWATWCAPCRAEMPALDKLQAAMGNKAFEVVAVNIDTVGADKPKKFLADIGVASLPFRSDPSLGIFKALQKVGRSRGLPTTMLIDGEGCEIGTMYGPAEWDRPEAQKLIQAALAK